MSDRVSLPLFDSMLRLLDRQLTAAEVSGLVDRLRGDAVARQQAAGLLLQIGALGELGQRGQDEVGRVPWQPRPRANDRSTTSRRRLGLVAAGCCLAAAAIALVVGHPRSPIRPSGSSSGRQVLARSAPGGAAAPAVLPSAGGAGRALLVSGGDGEGAARRDEQMFRRLQGLGFEVAQVSDDALSGDDLSSATLVVISASTAGAAIREQVARLGLREAPVPIVTCETATFDLLGLTSERSGRVNANGFGSAPGHDHIEIAAPGHALAAGLAGRLRVATLPVSLSWGIPSAGAIEVASLGGTGRHLIVQFAYERGAAMVGLPAPARRVGCFLSADAGEVLTEEGWRLFDAGVRWASGR